MYVKLVTTTTLFVFILVRLDYKCVIAEQRNTHFKPMGHSISDCIKPLWWWCRPHPVREHAQDLRPPLGARPASPPTRQAAQLPPLGPSTNPRLLE